MIFCVKMPKTAIIFVLLYGIRWRLERRLPNVSKVKHLEQSSGSYIVTGEITH